MRRKAVYFMILVFGLNACTRASSVAPQATADAVQIPAVLPTGAPAAQSVPTTTSEATAIHPAVLAKIGPENALNLQPVKEASISGPTHLKWSNDSAVLGALTEKGMVLLDGVSLKVKAMIVMESPITLYDFNPGAGWMATTSDEQTIDIRRITSGEVVRTLRPEGRVVGAAFSTDGTRLAIARDDNYAVDIWTVENGTRISTLQGFQSEAPTYQIHFSADGKHLIFISRAAVQVADLDTGTFEVALSHEDAVVQAELSASGSVIACGTAGSVNGTLVPIVQLWDPLKGQKLGTLLPEGQAVTSIAFSQTGRLLAVGAEKTVTLWDVAAQQPIAALTGHPDSISSLAFSPDGLTLASASADGLLRLWHAIP